MKTWTFLLCLGMTGTIIAQPYSLPNSNSGCPSTCRQIPWLAGSDIWNSGALPVYPVGTTCTGLTEGLQTTTDNTSAINSCITSTSSGNAATLPAGIYYIAGQVNLKAGTVLRGAGGGPGCQGRWLNGADSTDTWDNPGGSSGYWGDTLAVSSPAACTTTIYMGVSASIFSGYGGDIGTLLSLTGGYTKGSTALTSSTNPSSVSIGANTWIYISETADTGIPVTDVIAGGSHACTYCGLPSPNEGTYFMSQVVQVTSVTGSGPYTINISRPLYYTFQSTFSPIAGAMTNSQLHEGVENLIIADVGGTPSSRTVPNINAQGWIESWVKGIQIYNVSFNNNDYGVFCQFGCYGNEFRDSYIHYGGGSGSNGGGANYCFGFLDSNSDNKIENNICREDRHALVLEGGGSGNAFLYNYVDDMYDASVPGSTDAFINNARGNHGAHSYMNLWEGNEASSFMADFIHGSSSHNVLFRNWFWGDSTGNRFDWASDGVAGSLYNYLGFELDYDSHYYAAIGNVLGTPSGTFSGPYHANWSGGTAAESGCPGTQGTASAPVAYGPMGCDNNGGTDTPTGAQDTAVRSTAIFHGNYDYVTMGVLYWDGGSNHTLANSIYYSSAPSFFGSCAWPAFGPDLTPLESNIPAIIRYQQGTCSSGSCTVSPSSISSYIVGQSVSQQFTESNCTSGQNFTISSGSLSGSGLSLNTSGLLSGTAMLGAGVYSFTVSYNSGQGTVPIMLIISQPVINPVTVSGRRQ